MDPHQVISAIQGSVYMDRDVRKLLSEDFETFN